MDVKDQIHQVIAEWVISNGKLPGFKDRVIASLPGWNTVGPGGMYVYRGQGGLVKPPLGAVATPKELDIGIRPVIATSRDPAAVIRYAGPDCCMFLIKLQPGTRYIDVNTRVTFMGDHGDRALAIKNSVLEKVRDLCKDLSEGYFPTNKTPLPVIRKEILNRCLGRELKHEIIPAEREIMVYGIGGTMSAPVPIPGKINGKESFSVTYTPPSVGRGRTFRSKPKRKNKNGHRPTRKSGNDDRRNFYA
jgi:hypothetical protein